MVQECGVNEVEIDGRTFWVRPVGSWVLESGTVVAAAPAESLDKPFPWAIGFLFGNNATQLGTLEYHRRYFRVRRLAPLFFVALTSIAFHRL